MAEIDDQKTSVAGMEAQLATNKTTLDALVASNADLKAQLLALTSAGTPIDPAAVEAIAQQITTDTAALATEDASGDPPAAPGS